MSDREMFLKESRKLMKTAQRACEEAEEYLEDVVTDEVARDYIREAQESCRLALHEIEKL